MAPAFPGQLRSPWSSLELRLAQLAALLRLDDTAAVERAAVGMLGAVRRGGEAWRSDGKSLGVITPIHIKIYDNIYIYISYIYIYQYIGDNCSIIS